MKYLILFLIPLTSFALDNYIAKKEIGMSSGYSIYLDKKLCEKEKKGICLLVPIGINTSIGETFIDIDSKEKIRENAIKRAQLDASLQKQADLKLEISQLKTKLDDKTITFQEKDRALEIMIQRFFN